jgi:metal-dependent amidase/aminoacylase/carboxypeptidase family protein
VGFVRSSKETTFMSEKKPAEILASLATLLPKLQAVFKDIHAYPELSTQETRTAGIAANHLGASARSSK